MPQRRTAVASLLLALAAGAGLAGAVVATEAPAGLITGRVRDRAGDPLGGARVGFEGDDGTRHEAIAGPRGDFRVRLPEGRYWSVAATADFMPARTDSAIWTGEGEAATRLLFSLAKPADLGATSTVTVLGNHSSGAGEAEIALTWTPDWPPRSPGQIAGSWMVRSRAGDPLPGTRIRWRAIADFGSAAPRRLVGRGEGWTDGAGLAPIRFRPRQPFGSAATPSAIAIIAEGQDDLGSLARAETRVGPPDAAVAPGHPSAPVPFLPVPRFARLGDEPIIGGRRLDAWTPPVVPSGKSVGQAWSGDLARPAALEFAVPASAATGSAILTVEIAATPMAAGVAAAQALATDPGRGTDVAAARLLAGTAALAGGAAGPAATLLRRACSLAVADLARSQNRDGGWGWWPDLASKPDLSALAARALAQAQAAGLQAPRGVWAAATRYLRRTARGAEPDALATAVWALGPDAPLELRDRAWSGRKAMLAAPLGRLAEGLALAGDNRALEALALLDLRAVEEKSGAHWQGIPAESLGRDWDGGDVEATAQALRAHLTLGAAEDPAPDAARWLLRARRGDRWDGPRASAVAAAALAAFPVAPGAAPARALAITLDGLVQTSEPLPPTAPYVKAWGAASLPPGPHSLILSAVPPGTEPPTFTAMLRYQQYADPATPALAHKALEIGRRYVAIPNSRLARAGGRPLTEFCKRREARRLPAAGERLALDATVIVRLTVTARQALRFVRITDPLPAGAAAVPLPPDPAYHLALGPTEVTFDIPELPPGEHEFLYAWRPRVPGTYLAPAPTVEAVHTPDIRARGEAVRLAITE